MRVTIWSHRTLNIFRQSEVEYAQHGTIAELRIDGNAAPKFLRTTALPCI